jgi:hypothetical protein
MCVSLDYNIYMYVYLRIKRNSQAKSQNRMANYVQIIWHEVERKCNVETTTFFYIRVTKSETGGAILMHELTYHCASHVQLIFTRQLSKSTVKN